MQVVTTAGPAGGAVQLRVRGELDVASAPELTAVLDQLLAATPLSLVLELGELTFHDCAGMRPISAARRSLDAGTGSLVIRHPRPLVERTLRLAGLGEAVDRGRSL